MIGQAGGTLSGRTSIAYAEVAEHPLVGLDRKSPLTQWMDERLGPHAPAPRYRTVVPTLHMLITLATAGAGLAIVPRRAVDANTVVEICPLQDSWSTRPTCSATPRTLLSPPTCSLPTCTRPQPASAGGGADGANSRVRPLPTDARPVCDSSSRSSRIRCRHDGPDIPLQAFAALLHSDNVATVCRALNMYQVAASYTRLSGGNPLEPLGGEVRVVAREILSRPPVEGTRRSGQGSII